MTELLSNLSDALAGIVETTGQSVVRVEARRRLPASGVVWSPDGVIVTAHHVIQQDEAIGVGLPSGETVNATLVGRDPTTDLAVLRVGAASLSTAEWGGPDDLRVGHLVLALGRPGPRSPEGLPMFVPTWWWLAPAGAVTGLVFAWRF